MQGCKPVTTSDVPYYSRSDVFYIVLVHTPITSFIYRFSGGHELRADYVINMPQRAPSYYHWSLDKPCTTNAVYGYYMRDEDCYKNPKPLKKTGPFDYTRPFSNSGFFPQISYGGRLTTSKEPKMSQNLFDINRGYTMGAVPVTKKLAKNDVPVGFKLTRSVTAPEAFSYSKPRGKDIFLWHTLSGSLVHAQNFPPQLPTAAQ